MLAAKLLTTVAGFDYYVDSINGNDANAGTSEALAFQSLSAIPTLTDGQSVGFARGSTFRNERIPTLSADNTRFAAYGTGAKPIFDGSLVVSTWTKTGGYTNVYQASVSHGSAISAGYTNVYQDDANMTRVASLAACDSTAGTYYTTGDTSATTTVYTHATGSGDPNSNGSLYEVTASDWVINAASRTGMTIENLVMKRCHQNNGPLYGAMNCTLRGVELYDGAKHLCVLAGGASKLYDCILQDCYWGGANATLIAYYTLTPDNTRESIYVENTRFSCVNGITNLIDATIHHGGGGGTGWGQIQYVNCLADGVRTVLGPGDCTSFLVDGGTYHDVQTVLRNQSTSSPITVRNVTATDCSNSIYVESGSPTLVVEDSTLTNAGVSLAGGNATVSNVSSTGVTGGHCFTVSGGTSAFSNCTAGNATNGWRISAAAEVTLTDCDITNVTNGVLGSAATGTWTLTRVTVDGCTVGLYASSGSNVFTDCTVLGATAQGVRANGTLSLINLTSTLGVGAAFHVDRGGVAAVTVQGGTLTSVSAGQSGFRDYNGDMTVNSIDGVTFAGMTYPLEMGVVACDLIASDNNTFPIGCRWIYRGTTYTTLSAWRTATGFDLNSVQV